VIEDGLDIGVTGEGLGVAENQSATALQERDAELARYLPHLRKMSSQLQETALQIETSVVEVCNSFEAIAERSKATVKRTAGFLGRSEATSGVRSFESLIQSCGGTMLKIMESTAEAGEISLRAIERIEQMEKASQQIAIALRQLEHIDTGNKILALNARIEAAHSGSMGAGFAAVAVELASQTAKSRAVVAQVGELAGNLRGLAEFTLEDLRQMSGKDQERVEQCRREVDESLRELHGAHGEMKAMLSEMTEDGALLSNEIGSAVRGLQFQDRTNQRIAHVVEDLDTLQERMAKHLGNVPLDDGAASEGFSAYTMREERVAAGFHEAEAAGGDVELF
jgi:methyl-accepting chemotaxis protein